MKTQALRTIYQLKVTLKGSKPPVWRRFQMTSNDDLENLHIALQIVMGWSDDHLHQFVKDRVCYGIPDFDFPSDILDEVDFRLEQVLIKQKDKLIYEYDFGDGWQHELVLEKILPFDTSKTLPFCLEGSRACPPEDIGGVGGYMMFLEAIADPSHPEHEDMLDWFGGEFDPEYFNLAEVNDLLQEYCD